ncbi:hypothetical protein FNF29_06457 [Cafeteria roenbergensis]|uniref:Acyl-CoA thioesterase-like N-terminal HotDog domain-containing protein n=1 Tax=Cafeteria roenbergensis TaxID=33653 RepID=A0A5A8D060_CAFRO|nr:hypothetical protein FNF29_06457 [Cafeteria roenbergensis]KAA0149472.1 hypothetical protein FNF31_07210 [Cafeteria roenbergensis]KAA0158299.1 hypothetical protein FNF28_06307 [Cafeteria roenbergensis]|eukprot:KAA0148832.1 hypothetical protein FNF29_06457 [Cafeteria roenbergensis]
MAEAVQALVESLIRLEEIDKNLFRGSQLWTPDGARGVFGGQIIAQSLFAAARTRTESEKAMAPHSLHCYFLLPGSSESPALYTVRRVRDGRSFATRLVTTTQRGRPIFSSMVSFHSTREPTTLEHADAMPDAPDPDTLPNASERLASVLADPRLPEHLRPLVEHMGAQQTPIDFRYCDPVDVFSPEAMLPTRRTWFRAAQPLPGADSGDLAGPEPGCDGAVLHQDGVLVASTAQEGLIRTKLLRRVAGPASARGDRAADDDRASRL